MSKRKIYIKTLTTKDTKMLNVFTRVGYLTKDYLLDNLCMANKRIDNFVRDNYLEKVGYMDTKGNSDFVYRLTNKGNTLCTQKIGTDYFYRSSSPNHDLKLAYKYFKLDKDKQDNWVTEAEFRYHFNAKVQDLTEQGKTLEANMLLEDYKDGKLSAPDGGYMEEGQYIALEVITSSYRQADIQAKIEFCNTIGATYNQI